MFGVVLWTMIFIKSGAFLVFVWWWMFYKATRPNVLPDDFVVPESYKEVCKNANCDLL